MAMENVESLDARPSRQEHAQTEFVDFGEVLTRCLGETQDSREAKVPVLPRQKKQPDLNIALMPSAALWAPVPEEGTPVRMPKASEQEQVDVAPLNVTVSQTLLQDAIPILTEQKEGARTKQVVPELSTCNAELQQDMVFPTTDQSAHGLNMDLERPGVQGGPGVDQPTGIPVSSEIPFREASRPWESVFRMSSSVSTEFGVGPRTLRLEAQVEPQVVQHGFTVSKLESVLPEAVLDLGTEHMPAQVPDKQDVPVDLHDEALETMVAITTPTNVRERVVQELQEVHEEPGVPGEIESFESATKIVSEVKEPEVKYQESNWPEKPSREDGEGVVSVDVKTPEPILERSEGETQIRAVLDLQDRDNLFPKLVQRIESLVQEERSEVRIQLKPDHLGELKIKLSMERGIMVAEFVVQSQAVREVIASQLPQLQTALQDQGAEVGNVMVNVGFDQKGQGKEEESRSRQFSNHNGRVPRSATSDGAKVYRGQSLWNQVDLRV